MFEHIKNIWHPSVYHGSGKKGPFFEGWFFKVVNRERDRVFAFIPGIFLSENPEKSHAFIQVLDGEAHQSTYHRFSADQFQAKNGAFDISVDSSRFRLNGIDLDIHSENRSIVGSLSFSNTIPWPITPTAPGIMGWYAFTPFMQCYHGVPSLDHSIDGSLEIDGETVDFVDGRGYIEKDWGRSFPSAYVWMQCNHFSQSGVCLSASIARIPWLTGAFRGFIVGLLLPDRLLRFTTYTGAKVESLKVTDTHVHWVIRDRKHLLEIESDRAEGGLLHGPYDRDMTQKVSETLGATVHVKLSERGGSGNTVLFEDTGSPAGLDVNGELVQITG